MGRFGTPHEVAEAAVFLAGAGAEGVGFKAQKSDRAG